MTDGPKHLSTAVLEAGLDHVRAAPRDEGALRLIVRRPAEREREILDEGTLDVDVGLVGDGWKGRPSSKTPDGSAHPGKQITIMNARVIALLSGGEDPNHWAIAGDQLFVDLDISHENLPAGTLLSVGTATLEITVEPHTGCKKFVERFGLEAMEFISTPVGKELRMRGANAKVVEGGVIRRHDVVKVNRRG